MTLSERRIRTEVRFWAFVILLAICIVTFARSDTALVMIGPAIGQVLFLILACLTHNDLKRLDAEAKQEEWS